MKFKFFDFVVISVSSLYPSNLAKHFLKIHTVFVCDSYKDYSFAFDNPNSDDNNRFRIDDSLRWRLRRVSSREIAKMREEELEQFTNFLNLSKTGFTAPLYFIQGTVGSGKTHLIERGRVKKVKLGHFLDI